MKIFRLLLIISFFSLPFSYLAASLPSTYTVHTLYGSATLQEPVLIELIHSQAMQRLKKINQYGVMHFIGQNHEYTRYEHSIGVLFLMRKYGAPLAEQVMGLLHDVSHTVFSHAADYLFGTVCSKESYQDQMFVEYVTNTDILPILKKHNLDWICPASARAQCIMLKDDLPNLCADRLEYNLYGGFIEGWITQDHIQNLLRHLTYRNGQWLFDDSEQARLFALISLRLSKDIWCAAWNGFIFTESANLLKRGMELNLITMNDFIYSIDEKVWNTLSASDDPLLMTIIDRLKNYEARFTLGSPDNHDIYVKGKFRTVDPLIITTEGFKRLGEIDGSFKQYCEKTKAELAIGWYIKYR